MKGVVSCLALFVLLVAVTAAAAQEKAKAGDVVWAEWKPNAWYHGTIAKVDGKDFHIAFDDGDKAILDTPKIVLDRAQERHGEGRYPGACQVQADGVLPRQGHQDRG